MGDPDEKNKIDQIGAPGDRMIGSGHTEAHKDLIGPTAEPYQDAQEPKAPRCQNRDFPAGTWPAGFLVDGAVIEVFQMEYRSIGVLGQCFS